MNASGVNYDVNNDFFAQNNSSTQPPAFINQQAFHQQQDEGFIQKVRQLGHPASCFFHIFFKAGALFTYLFAGFIFPDDFVIAFITCVTLLAFDFWVVKNITGRLLVGLRWWNEIKEDGTNEWIFESLEDKSRISGTEKAIFWGASLLTPMLWILFAVVSFLKLHITWLIVVIIALALSAANLFGYIKCAREARSRLKNMATKYIAGAVIQQGIKNATSA